jgi:outer membrane immunogenic protein
MKRMLIGTIAAGALVVGGHAGLCADVDVSVPTLFNYWNGAYLGLVGGWGLTTTRGLNASGDFGGGQIGYNYQMGNLVFGLEGDGAFANIISRDVTTASFGTPNSVGYRNDGLASLRGRFGVNFNNILFYGTAGGAWGHSRVSTSVSASVTAAAWQAGWSAGGGVEYGFLPSWSVKAEYLHYGLASETYFGTLNTGKINLETFKVGVNYLFH